MNGMMKQAVGLAALVGCIVTTILAFVLIYKNAAYVLYYESAKIYKTYENQELCKIALSDANRMKQKFLEYKFESQADGLLFRKKFSPWKDFISYYVSISEENDIKKITQMAACSYRYEKSRQFLLDYFCIYG